MLADGRHAGAAALISPLAAAGRAEEVVARVSQAIKLGLFIDGEQLPAEAEFAAQLGVSAMTLREALAVLRQQGLVETRRGRTGGTFVRRPASPPLQELRSRLRGMTVSTLRDLADEQFAVSGTAARLAAARASAGNVRRLLILAEQLRTASSLGSRIRADSRFHIEVALASQSERLTRLEVGLQTQLAELLWLPHDRELDVAEVAAEHHSIAEAIAAEDGERARALAEQHIEHGLRRLTLLRLAAAEAGLGTSMESSFGSSFGSSFDRALGHVRAALEDVFGHVSQVAGALTEEQRSCRRAGEQLTAERLSRLRDVMQRQLAELPSAAGVGVVAAPGLVAGHERHLEWWQRGAGGGYTRLRLNLDRASIDLYDYLDMDWFTVPRTQRRRCVYGPYIDFTCADRYVLTMTVPLLDSADPADSADSSDAAAGSGGAGSGGAGGRFLGVAGADVAMSHFEPGLLAILRCAPPDTVLVTAERRVLAANTPRWIAGARLGRLPVAGDGTFSAAAEVGADSGWVLAVAAG
jgi:DNA-binding FadR family transcriptional regulator